MTSPLEVTLRLHDRTRMGGLPCTFELNDILLRMTHLDTVQKRECAPPIARWHSFNETVKKARLC